MGIDRRTAVVLGGSRRAVGSFVASGGQDVGPRPAPGMTLGSGQMTRGPVQAMTLGLAVRQRAMAAHASPRVMAGASRPPTTFVASGGQDVGPRPAPGMTLGSGQMMARGLGPGMTLGLGPGMARGLAVRQRATAAHASPRVMAGAGRPPTTFVASGGQDVGPRPAPGMTRGLGQMTLGSGQMMARGPAPGMTLGSGVTSAVERRS
jgi:hypothetical protein